MSYSKKNKGKIKFLPGPTYHDKENKSLKSEQKELSMS
jgi:hypothetical protein